MKLVEGEKCEFSCVIKGNPHPEIIWQDYFYF